MLSKKNRADKKAVNNIFKKGRFLNSPNLTFKFLIKQSFTPKISVIVPKSLAKLAVKRNSLRRRAYRVLSKYINSFPLGLVAVLVFKKYQEDNSIIENEIKNILNKFN